MVLQIKLVNDGYAATYVSQEAARLSDWANWKDQAWGVTAEPIVIVYNKRLLPPDQVPNSHHALRRYLETINRSRAAWSRPTTLHAQPSAISTCRRMSRRRARYGGSFKQ